MHDGMYHEYNDAQKWVEVESFQSESEEDEEVARQIAIEESQRKLAELETDRPLWEAAAKQRSMREEAERESIRVKVTAEERAEAERKARTNGVEVESLSSEEDDEEARRIAIEESRRKLAELEADKPLWEAAAKQRSMREESERERIRVKVTERKARIFREAEEKRKENEKHQREAEAKRKEDERRQREAEEKRKEDERRQQEAEAKRKEDERRQRDAAARRERQRQKQRWAYGIWTTERTLERYKVMNEEFDSTKFSPELPLIIEAVPWPVLTPPARLNIADVDWDAVEKFFSAIKGHMKPQEYKALVEKSHRRFHPDRWQSRNLWKAVVDETERDDMIAAVNAVAQALTPIWRAVTGR